MATVPTAFDTFTTSEVVTAAKMNKNVRDAGNFFRQPPALSVQAATATSIATATWSKPTLGTVHVDTDTVWDAATTKAVIKTAGLYLISGAVLWSANATGGRGCSAYINGTTTLMAAAQASATPLMSITNFAGIRRLNVNDTVELYGYQNSGAALNAAGVSPLASTRLDLVWIGA